MRATYPEHPILFIHPYKVKTAQHSRVVLLWPLNPMFFITISLANVSQTLDTFRHLK